MFADYCEYFDFIDAHLLDMTTEKRLIELRERVASWNQLAIDNNCAVKELITRSKRIRYEKPYKVDIRKAVVMK